MKSPGVVIELFKQLFMPCVSSCVGYKIAVDFLSPGKRNQVFLDIVVFAEVHLSHECLGLVLHKVPCVAVKKLLRSGPSLSTVSSKNPRICHDDVP